MSVSTIENTTVDTPKMLVFSVPESGKVEKVVLCQMTVPSQLVSSVSFLIQMEMDCQVVSRAGTTITGELSVTTTLMRTTTRPESSAAPLVFHPVMHTS